MSEDLQEWRGRTVCKCGERKTSDARSCRTCYCAGRGAKAERRGRSIDSILAEVNTMNLKPGQSVTFEGIRITKK